MVKYGGGGGDSGVGGWGGVWGCWGGGGGGGGGGLIDVRGDHFNGKISPHSDRCILW